MEIFNIFNIVLFFLIALVIWFLIGLKWEKSRMFFHKRYSFFEFSFILLYFIEQIALSYFIYLGYNAQIIAGVFSIIIITTASLQNKCWGSRAKKIGEKFNEQNNLITLNNEQKKIVIEDNKKLKAQLEKSEKFIDEVFEELNKNQKIIEELKKKG